MRAALSRFRDAVGDGYALGAVRVVVGILLGFRSLAAAGELANNGYFGDVFHVSMLPELLVPSHRMYAVIVALRVCFAVMVTLGIWARPSLALSAFLGGWVLLCDRLQFQDDAYSLLLSAFLLSFTPCDRSWRSTDTAVLAPRVGPFWAVRLLRFQVSLVYLASGGAKLLSPAFRDGVVIADYFAHHPDCPIFAVLSHRAAPYLAQPTFASAFAKAAIMTELVVCVALWLKPTRVIALWWGLWFHLIVLVTFGLGPFTWLTLAMYGTFATPDYHARKLRFDPSRTMGKIAGTVVPLLDWLGRFQVKPWEPDAQHGHSIVVVRRDGERVTGIRAFAMLTRCLPLLFPIWAPVALVASFTRQGDLTADE